MFKNLSIQTIKEKLLAGCQRFPLVILFAVLSTMGCIYLNHQENIMEAQAATLLVYYPITAMLLALVLKLWSEEVKNHERSAIIQVLLHIGWFGLVFWLSNNVPVGIVESTAMIALPVVLLVMLFVVSFLKRQTELCLWNFTYRLLIGIIISLLAASVLMAGIQMLIEAFKQLFEWNIDYRYRIDIVFASYTFVFPLIFLQFIPEQDQKHDESSTGLPSVLLGIVHYALIPLLLAYFLTLYSYAIKILATWQLPNGWVSWLVTAMMLGTLTIMGLLYPLQFHKGKKFDKYLLRWLPVAALPLLVLMSIGIGRRLSDYGITVARLYVLTFNIWCYAVCLYLILNKSRRMLLVPVSFAMIALLTSVGPQSYANITLHSMKNQVKQIFAQAPNQQLPITKGTLSKFIETLPKDQQEVLMDKGQYLTQNYRADQQADMWNKENLLYFFINNTIVTDNIATEESYSIECISEKPTPIPSGYRSFIYVINSRCEIVKTEGDNITAVVEINDKKYEFTFSQKQLKSAAHASKPSLLYAKGENMLLAINYLYLTIQDEVTDISSIQGIIFIK
uniref:DUF4153 domain-containing protein n=1 Tax=Prevotella sp. GTC17262 TaxID=3236797 RepID=A0AB33JQ04_9BACT